MYRHGEEQVQVWPISVYSIIKFYFFTLTYILFNRNIKRFSVNAEFLFYIETVNVQAGISQYDGD